VKNAGLATVDFQVDFRRYVDAEDFARVSMGIIALQQQLTNLSWWMFSLGRSNDVNSPFFKSKGGRWQAHCVAGANGSAWLSALGWHGIASLAPEESLMNSIVHQNGGYSFVDSLRLNNIRRLVFCGLGTEYGIRSTVLEALKAGFKVDVVTDLCAAYNMNNENEGIDAILDMEDAGARLLTSSEVVHGVARPVEKVYDEDDGRDNDDR